MRLLLLSYIEKEDTSKHVCECRVARFAENVQLRNEAIWLLRGA